MTPEYVPVDEAGQLTPATLCGFAESLRWVPVPIPQRPEIAVYHHPDSNLHQVIIPVDTGLVDYADAAADAIRKLAKFLKQPAIDVIRELLAQQKCKAATAEVATP